MSSSLVCLDVDVLFFFFNQKTAYDMRISDLSSDVCSSDLQPYTDEIFLGAIAQEDLVGIGLRHHAEARPPLLHQSDQRPPQRRSEERRVGKECVRKCRCRW